MGHVKVAGFSVSLDGFGAGPEQSLQDPLGKNGPELFGWFFGMETFFTMVGQDSGSEGVDERFGHLSRRRAAPPADGRAGGPIACPLSNVWALNP